MKLVTWNINKPIFVKKKKNNYTLIAISFTNDGSKLKFFKYRKGIIYFVFNLEKEK